MQEWYIAGPLSLAIVVLSGFFVIIEFSLMGARRHRLEDTAETSAASRAALRSLNELTIMLAGAQLGITAATFALGAITKPWMHHLLMPGFAAVGISGGLADTIAFLVSLLLVTFLHLVVGEMAPKSWAIAHPELAVRVIALPARGFIWIFRPLLKWINLIANKLVAATGVQPVDRAGAQGYDTDTLRTLVQHSGQTGAMDQKSAQQISGVIELENSTVSALARAHGVEITPLPHDTTVRDVQEASRSMNRLRVVISDAESAVPRVVHVRDTLLQDPDSPAADVARPALSLAGSTKVQHAIEHMRALGEQIVVVGRGNNSESLWILNWDDIMGQLWPEITKQLEREA